MRPISVFLLVFVMFGCQTNENPSPMYDDPIKVTYPTTKKVDVVDNYHGTKVEDPYRWLEHDTAKEVKSWVKEQNKVTQTYLSHISYRDDLRKRYEALYNYPKVSSPLQAGEYIFFYKNDGLQNQAVIYKQKGLDGEPEVFIDPNEMDEQGTTSVSLIGFSEDHTYVAYSVQKAGSDWQTIYVKEVESGKILSDELKWVKFSSAAWHNDGFYYSRYPAPAKGMEYSSTNQYHAVYYHRLGTPQESDKLVFGDKENPLMYHFSYVTEDGSYLIVNKASGTDGYELFVKNLTTDGNFRQMQEGFEYTSRIVDHHDGYFLVHTNINAPNYRLVKVSTKDLSIENGVDVIAEKEHLLESVSTGGGYLFANYLEKASNHIYRYDIDGTFSKEIELPGIGSASGFYGKKGYSTLFYTYTSFVRPPSIYSYDVASGKSEIFFETPLKFNPEEYVEKQITYPSKDSTPISMFIVHKKGLNIDGKRPTYLYGYGGFNISLTPSFSASRILLLENDGVFAMPNLRGGGEYGEEWHEAGMLENKQNVFDDFIAAAEFLIEEGYTSSEHLGIAGRSNGGLLVGACMTQRPELYAVTFPGVGVLDMLRYHKFTVGWGWVPEYGSSDQPDQFPFLYAYSPLHNVEQGKEYPPTMITTADHDDRVVPAHSFKFAARLQEAQKGDNPILIRIDTDAGHGAGKPTSFILDEQADVWSFFFHHTKANIAYQTE